MARLMFVVVVVLMADCALGLYLDWRVRHPHFVFLVGTASSADAVLARDSADRLLPMGTVSHERRVYATYTSMVNSGYFRTRGGWWRLVWNGHAWWFVAPSWSYAAPAEEPTP